MKKPSRFRQDGFFNSLNRVKSGCKLDHDGRSECLRVPVFNDTGFGFLSDLDCFLIVSFGFGLVSDFSKVRIQGFQSVSGFRTLVS